MPRFQVFPAGGVFRIALPDHGPEHPFNRPPSYVDAAAETLPPEQDVSLRQPLPRARPVILFTDTRHRRSCTLFRTQIIVAKESDVRRFMSRALFPTARCAIADKIETQSFYMPQQSSQPAPPAFPHPCPRASAVHH